MRDAKGRFVKGAYGSEAGHWKNRKTIFICKQCKKEFSGYLRLKRVFCTRKCRCEYSKGRPSWNFGLHGDEWLKHYRNGHPRGAKGLKKSEKWYDAMHKIVPWNKGYGNYMKGEKNHFYGKMHTEEFKNRQRITRLNRVFPVKDTLIERMMQQKLIENKIEFKKHKPLLGICQCDVFIEPNIAIFVDGCYWHGCEQCLDRNKLESWIRGKRVRDEIITQALMNRGYIILRFWEHEIHSNIDLCIEKIKQCMESVRIEKQE